MNPDSDRDITGPPRATPTRLVYEPLGEWIPHRAFSAYGWDAALGCLTYTVTAPVALEFPPYVARFRTCSGHLWRVFASGRIEADPGFTFAPSGPAIDDESSVVGSLAHDVLCHPVLFEGPPGKHRLGYPAGYWRSHRLYRWINRTQGMHPARAWYQWAALVACNWTLRLNDWSDLDAPT